MSEQAPSAEEAIHGTLAGISPEIRKTKVTAILAALHLSDRAHHKPEQLSGGERQRVAIARATITEPAVLLADEPTGNLDSGTSDAIYNLFQGLHEARDLTMTIVTHSDQLASRLDRVVTMEDGCISGS